MTAQPAGECCMCGKETTQRCSACDKDGVSLFFCSREHQKLVWSAHKQICGPKSKPLSFPPLSESERAEAEALLSRSFKASGVQTTPSECLQSMLPGSPAEILHSLTQPEQNSAPSSARAEALCFVRTLPFNLSPSAGKSAPRDKSQPVEMTPLAFVHFVAASYALGLHMIAGNTTRPSSEEAFPLDEDWYINILHHALVLGTLHYLNVQSGPHLAHQSKGSKTPESRKHSLKAPLKHFIKLVSVLLNSKPVEGQAMQRATTMCFQAVGIDVKRELR